VHGRVGRIPRPAGADLQVGVPAVERRRGQLVVDLAEPEADAGVRGPEAAHQVGHEPGAASYTSDADLNDLHAILDRYSDRETAEIRRLLASRRAA
jgi:hypothetical protein